VRSPPQLCRSIDSKNSRRNKHYGSFVRDQLILGSYRNQVGTHADSLIAEAVLKGFDGFDLDIAWEAVLKDATIPPVNDWNIS
jgi:hypothetical protein